MTFSLNFPALQPGPSPVGDLQANPFGAQLVAASRGECQVRFGQWDQGLLGFLQSFNGDKQALEEDLRLSRGGGVPPHLRLEALQNARAKIGPMREAAEAQVQIIDDLLLDCHEHLTDAQKTRLNDMKGSLSGDIDRLRNLEWRVPVAEAGIRTGQAVDGALETLGDLIEGVGSWIPPIPMPRLPSWRWF